MKVIGQLLALVILLALVAAMVFGIVLAWRLVVATLASLDPQVATVTAIGCIVALAAAYIISRGLKARPGLETAELRNEKTATYQLMVDFWRNVSDRPHALESLPVEMAEKLEVLDRLLLLYGSAAVIHAHSDLREAGRQKGMVDPQTRVLLGKALLEIRKDLGADSSKDIVAELQRLLSPVPADPRGTSASRFVPNA